MKTMLIMLAVSILIVFVGRLAFLGYNPDDAIDAIVGEASNQSYDTMICIAQAIRHRGTLRGVYGLHARHNYLENSSTWTAAEEAWEDSELIKDRVGGAKNWGTREDLAKLQGEGLLAGRTLKAHCGDFYFY